MKTIDADKFFDVLSRELECRIKDMRRGVRGEGFGALLNAGRDMAYADSLGAILKAVRASITEIKQ